MKLVKPSLDEVMKATKNYRLLEHLEAVKKVFVNSQITSHEYTILKPVKLKKKESGGQGSLF